MICFFKPMEELWIYKLLSSLVCIWFHLLLFFLSEWIDSLGLICQFWVKSLEHPPQLNSSLWKVDVSLRQMKKIWAWHMQSCQYLDVFANKTNVDHTLCSANWFTHGVQIAHQNKCPTRWNTSSVVMLSTGTRWQYSLLHIMLKAIRLTTTVMITVLSCIMYSGHGSSEP